MKESKIFIGIGAFMIFVVAGLIWLASQSEGDEISDAKILNMDGIILFYGDGCPHCKDVEEFNEKNDMKNKVAFEELEVWKNEKNAELMKKAAEICDISPKQIGVPLLFAEGECHVGGPDVKDFFKEKAGI